LARHPDIEKGFEMAERIAFELNEETRTVEVAPDTPLLYVLRNELGLSNPHFGCGLAQCGACTVHVDGAPTRSCSLPVSAATGTKVTTLAGLGTPEHPHPLQVAFVAEQVPQCGYCLNGWIMTAAALLRDTPHPSELQIRDGLSGLKCRCGTHMAILRAVRRAAQAA
jgi:aerobic-type carbon monoxide dehydrogenase small subunit (CoxS/CutS family)